MTYYRPAKFGNIPNRCSEGIMHQSKLEAARCTELHLMQKGGLIRDLQAHPQRRFRLEVPDPEVKNLVWHICDYMADFSYFDAETGREVVEDCKGVKTREYALKAKLMKACLGIEIQEVRSVRGSRQR